MPDTAPPDPVQPRPALRERVKTRWRKGLDWCARQWRQIRPGPEARRGAVWGTLAAAALCVAIAGLYARTGFGYAFDFAFAFVFAALLIPLVALAVALLLTIALAAASYHWLETPFLSLKKRFTYVKSRPV